MEKYEVIQEIAESIEGKKPYSWCDDDSFDAYDEGFYSSCDDTLDVIKECDGTSVVSFCWRNETKELGSIIPELIKEEPTLLYKKGGNSILAWDTEYKGYKCRVLNFRSYENDNGTDYPLYWYLISFN